jgi:glycosyltransferase involved in cell wall biosynthesis
MQRVPLCTCVGSFLKDRFPNKPVHYVPNGLNLDHFPVIEKKAARRAVGLNEDIFLVTTVARIMPIKGIDVLIEAIRKLQKKNVEIRVNIIGAMSGKHGENSSENSYAESLRRSAAGLPVNFTGFISNRTPEFQNLLAASDMLVVPSRFEPQGLTVMEGMALGVPVLGSRAGGIPDMIQDHVGALFAAGNSEDLASKLEFFYCNREQLGSMSQNCRTHIKDNFSWKLVAENYLEKFKAIAN